MAANPTRISKPLLTILVAGLVAGLFDITYACIFFGLRNHVSPTRIFQSVARGALGQKAFEGGVKTALLGLFFHFLIALMVATIFFLASRVVPFLIDHAVISGLLYGLGVLWAFKARVEERYLRDRYPEYDAYARRVRFRLVPWLY